MTAVLRAVAEVQAELLADAQLCRGESCALMAANGRILREDIVAACDVPPADNSAMDGYALRLDDLTPQGLLPVSQRIAAGHPAKPLAPGSAARIFTGAELPAGADCVVAQEDCTLEGGQLRVAIAPRLGQHIRPRGQDIAAGSVVVAAGHRLSAADIGLMASVGVAQCTVARRLKVVLLSTGDELREPGELLGAAQIYNSNRPMLMALLHNLGCEVVDLGIVADTAAATAEALRRASEQADMVISSGGVSVGEEDHVKAQLEKQGRLTLWKLAIKPGKPLAYGRLGERPFFGLPGNPVSSFVTFCLLVRPYILAVMGCRAPLPAMRVGRANFDWPRAGSRQEYLRAQVSADGALSLHPQQSSGALSSVAWCNALAVIPPGTTLRTGDALHYIPLSELGVG